MDMCVFLVEAEVGIATDRREGLRTLISRSRAAFQRRDQYVHGMSSVDGETLEWSTMRTRRSKAELQFGPMNGDDLAQLVMELNELSGALMGWLVSMDP